MKRMIRAYGCAFVLGLVWSAVAQPQYEAIDLGAIYHLGTTEIADINNEGEMVGSLGYSGGAAGFVIDSTGFHYLPALPTGQPFFAARINNNGTILGYANLDDPPYPLHTLLYQNGQYQDIGFPGITEYPGGRDLNDSNVVVGENAATRRAARWENGTLTNLPYTGIGSAAYAVNSTGDATGYGVSSLQVLPNAVRWTGAGFSNLSPPGALESIARDINDARSCVGWLEDSVSRRHAVMWDPSGQLTDLGDFSGGVGEGGGESYKINSAGQIVGYANDSTGLGFGFLWQSGTMYRLQDLIVGSGWQIGFATCLNDRGQIICYGSHNGLGNTWLLNPVAEPCTLAYLSVTIGLLRFRKKR